MAGDGGEDARRVEAVGAMYAKYKKGHFADVEDVSAEEALEMAAAHDAVVFVDTRSEQEVQVSTIPNAVAGDAFLSEMRGGKHDGKTAVAFCTIGMRSGKFVKAHAADAKGRNVRLVNLRGSVLSWTHAGGALVDPAGNAVKDVHVYAAPWDLARSDHTPHFMADNKGFFGGLFHRLARLCA